MKTAKALTKGAVSYLKGNVASDYQTTIIYPEGTLSGLPERDGQEPDTPEIEASTVTLTKADIDALRWVLKAAPRDDVRYHLNGVFIDHEARALVGCDGHRLHIADCIALDACQQSAIIPRDTIKHTLALVRETKADSIALKIGEDQVWISVSDVRVHARRIDATYPAWQRLVSEIDSNWVKIGIDLPALLAKHKTDIHKHSGMGHGYSLAKIEESGNVIDAFGNVYGSIGAEINQPIGINLKYGVDVKMKGATGYFLDVHNQEKFHFETDTRRAVIMAARV